MLPLGNSDYFAEKFEVDHFLSTPSSYQEYCKTNKRKINSKYLFSNIIFCTLSIQLEWEGRDENRKIRCVLMCMCVGIWKAELKKNSMQREIHGVQM